MVASFYVVLKLSILLKSSTPIWFVNILRGFGIKKGEPSGFPMKDEGGDVLYSITCPLGVEQNDK
jgi:hypothetical protein